MSAADDRDAYAVVEVPLPNGKIARGKSIPWPEAKKMIVLSSQFVAGGTPTDTLIPLLQQFEAVTGITEAYLMDLDPNLSAGELVDFVNRFFYWRRPARTEAPPPANPPAAAPGSGG